MLARKWHMNDTRAVVVIVVLRINNDLYHISLVYAALIDGHFIAQQLSAVEPTLTACIDALHGLKVVKTMINKPFCIIDFNERLTCSFFLHCPTTSFEYTGSLTSVMVDDMRSLRMIWVPPSTGSEYSAGESRPFSSFTMFIGYDRQ